MTTHTILSYAKINLALKVLQQDANSYHKINTLICCLTDYYDVLEISPSANLQIKTSGKYAFEGSNTLEKVAHLFKKEFGGNVNFAVNIIKNIKTGGGLGGGSSNASAFLHFLLKQNQIFLSKKAFCNFAFKIGADVPFFYNTNPKICSNYGEVIQDIKFAIPKTLFALLYIPDFETNTKQAFSLLNHGDFKPNSKFESFDEVLSSFNPFLFSAQKINPQIMQAITELKSLFGTIKVDISGSGSCCFALFENEGDLLEAIKKDTTFYKVYSKIIL